jgi:hypothetical protein
MNPADNRYNSILGKPAQTLNGGKQSTKRGKGRTQCEWCFVRMAANVVVRHELDCSKRKEYLARKAAMSAGWV